MLAREVHFPGREAIAAHDAKFAEKMETKMKLRKSIMTFGQRTA
jgi:hypothetical protein